MTPGTVIGDKFRVVRTLGKGGMGVVYEVVHELTKHRRALKLLHGEVSRDHPDLVRRFLREASVAGTLGDHRIVETFDAGQLPSGEPYVVMELLEGETLAARIERERLPLRDAVSIAGEVAGAMTAAHAKGITHRDLKPENIFLTRDTVKVLDFGISKFALESDAAATQEGIALGTPYYMAPEQLRAAKDLDGRVDVYAIGVLLYEAIAGRRPFDAPTMAALVVKISEGDATPLATLRPDAPEPLTNLIARAMHRDRSLRVQSAEELAALLRALDLPTVDVLAATTPLAVEPALAATLPSMPPTATPPPRAERRRWGLIALIVLPLLAIGGWVAAQHREPPVSTPVAPVTPVATPAVAAPSPTPLIASAAPTSSPSVSSTAAIKVKPTVPVPKHSAAGMTENPL